MTRSPLARVLTILGLTALMAVSACGNHNDRPALTGDVVTTTTTTSTTAAP